jgi:bacteriocin resistance YdeI/OmpD-like protein/uncharacterized protein DUF1905
MTSMPLPTKNPGVIRYTATLQQTEGTRGTSSWIDFPYDLKELYGIGNLVPAIMTFDDIEYRGSIAKMGGTYPMLLIRNDILAKLGKSNGDSVMVTVTLDDKPREVIVPLELLAQFKQHADAKAIYEAMAYSHRKEYARWVGEAKQAETRQRRAEKALVMLLEHKKLS